MSELRDARLLRALESAPDAGLRPDDRTREAVRRAAMEAVAAVAAVGVADAGFAGAAGPEAPAAAPGVIAPAQRPAQAAEPGGWRRLWAALWPGGSTAGSAQRMPWNAALATVLLASLVTLLWRDQDIPGAEPGLASADRPVAAAPAAAPAATAPPGPAAAAPPAQDAATSSAPEAPAPAGKAPPAATSKANADAAATARPVSPAKPSAAASPALAERHREVRAEPAPEAAYAAPAREDRSAFAKSAPASQVPGPAPGLADAARSPAPVVTQSRMDAADSVAAAAPPRSMPMPVPVPAPAASPPAPAAAAATLSAAAPMAKAAAPAGVGVGAAVSRRAEVAASALDAWTQARIVDGSGRVVQIDRTQAPALPSLVRAALAGGPVGGMAAGPAGESPFGPPTLRLELLQGGQRLGVLEVAGPVLRLTPAAADGLAGPARVIQPDPARLQALVDELARLGPR